VSLRQVFFVNAEDPAVAGRIAAIEVGRDVVAGAPMFGAPLDFIWPDSVAPHQLMFYFAALHGVPAGILLTILLWVGVRIRLRYARASLSGAERWLMHTCVIIGWTVLGTAMTNNFAAPVLFWTCWAIGCAPLLRGWPEKKAAHPVAAMRRFGHDRAVPIGSLETI